MKKKLFLLLCALLTMIGVTQVKADGYTDYINEANGWTQVTDNAGIATDGSAVYAIVASDFGLAVGIPDEGSASQLTYQTVSGQPTRTQVWSIESDTYGSGGYALKNLGNREKYVQAETASWDMHANSDSKNIAKTCYQFSINDGTLYIQTNNDVFTDTGGRYWGDWSVGTHVNGSSLAGNKAEANRVTFKLYKKILSVPGQDYTFLLANPSFETGDMTGWSTLRGGVVQTPSLAEPVYATSELVADYPLTNSDGDYICNYYIWSWSWNADANGIQQVIEDLPAGSYRVEAVIGGWKDWEMHLMVNEETQSQTMTTDNEGVSFSVDITLASATDLTITAKTTHTGYNAWEACFMKADNFRLTYLGDASANLKVNDGKLGTFIAPFDVVLPSGVKAYSATSDATKVILKKEFDGGQTLPAGTPVIIYGDGVSVNTNFYGNSTVATNQTVGALTGMLVDKTVPANAYVLQTQESTQAFYQLETSATASFNRCYVTANSVGSGARLAIVFEDDDPTAIKAIEAAEAEAEGGLKDGKYFVKGRIVIVKNGKAFSTNGQKLN